MLDVQRLNIKWSVYCYVSLLVVFDFEACHTVREAHSMKICLPLQEQLAG